MINDYVMPKLAMAMNEGTINEWLAKEGDFVSAGTPIVTVETEKVSYDLDSPHSGFLHIVIPEGETVLVEVTIARLAETEQELTTISVKKDGEVDEPVTSNEPEMDRVTMQESKHARVKASPVVRKLAREKSIDLNDINGSGPGGRIVKRDILEAVTAKSSNGSKPAQEQSGDDHASTHLPDDQKQRSGKSASVMTKTVQGFSEKARIPVKGKVRATIAKRMLESLHSSAQLSSAFESDLTRLLQVRESFLSREQQLGTRVSMNAFLIKAIVYAIHQLPLANSAMVGDEIVLYENVNMGIAVALPGETEYDSTLIVPVLKQVEQMGVVEIDKQMKALIGRARSGNLSAEDMTESTITLSSTAGLAPPGLQSTPVLNMPNAVIIGPSTPQQKPVVYDGKVVVRTILPISVTFDHRVIDGEPAARFMMHLHECVENPELLLA